MMTLDLIKVKRAHAPDVICDEVRSFLKLEPYAAKLEEHNGKLVKRRQAVDEDNSKKKKPKKA